MCTVPWLVCTLYHVYLALYVPCIMCTMDCLYPGLSLPVCPAYRTVILVITSRRTLQCTVPYQLYFAVKVHRLRHQSFHSVYEQTEYICWDCGKSWPSWPISSFMCGWVVTCFVAGTLYELIWYKSHIPFVWKIIQLVLNNPVSKPWHECKVCLHHYQLTALCVPLSESPSSDLRNEDADCKPPIDAPLLLHIACYASTCSNNS